MCEPITTAAGAMMWISGITTAASLVMQYQSAQSQARALGRQNQAQADEISRQAGLEMHERARAARRERAYARAAASEAGINLSSNSFLSALQTSYLNQYSDMGIIAMNERARQRARAAEASAAASRIDMPNWVTAGLQIGGSMYGGYQAGKAQERAAIAAAGGVVAPKTDKKKPPRT